MADRAATFYAGISIVAAVATIGLKVWAWKITGSVGLLSDAAESGVNLLAALVALWALWRASKPADATIPTYISLDDPAKARGATVTSSSSTSRAIVTRLVNRQGLVLLHNAIRVVGSWA